MSEGKLLLITDDIVSPTKAFSEAIIAEIEKLDKEDVRRVQVVLDLTVGSFATYDIIVTKLLRE